MESEDNLTSMTVSLPSSQKAYVQAQARATGCATPSEYIRRLLQADRERREQDALERRLFAELGSGTRDMTAADWEALRESLRRRLANRRPGGAGGAGGAGGSQEKS